MARTARICPAVLTLCAVFALAGDARAQGIWSTRTPLPAPRFAHTATELNGLIHVVGGLHTQTCSFLTTHEVYDPVSNTWTAKAPMFVGRAHAGAGVVDGILYVVGGDNGCGSETSSMEAYDPGTNTWTLKASLPTARGGLMVAVLNGVLYAVGGYQGATRIATVEAYDPDSDTCAVGPQIFAMGQFTAVGKVSTFTPDTPIRVTRIELHLVEPPSGCATNARVRLTDGTTSQVLTINAAHEDSGTLAIDYAAGTQISVHVSRAAAGCAVLPSAANVVVQYRSP